MKLTYRGKSYDYTPPTVEYGDAIAAGKYRGLDIRFRNPQKKPVLQATLDLKYRDEAAQAPAQPLAQPEVAEAPVAALASTVAASVDHLARSLMLNQSRIVKQRQQDMLSRLAVEVGVSDDVAENWSRIQGKLHPTFRVNYGRSGAAMS